MFNTKCQRQIEQSVIPIKNQIDQVRYEPALRLQFSCKIVDRRLESKAAKKVRIKRRR